MKRGSLLLAAALTVALPVMTAWAQARPDSGFKSIHQSESETHRKDTTEQNLPADNTGRSRVMTNVSLIIFVIILFVLVLAVLLIARRVYRSRKE